MYPTCYYSSSREALSQPPDQYWAIPRKTLPTQPVSLGGLISSFGSLLSEGVANRQDHHPYDGHTAKTASALSGEAIGTVAVYPGSAQRPRQISDSAMSSSPGVRHNQPTTRHFHLPAHFGLNFFYDFTVGQGHRQVWLNKYSCHVEFLGSNGDFRPFFFQDDLHLETLYQASLFNALPHELRGGLLTALFGRLNRCSDHKDKEIDNVVEACNPQAAQYNDNNKYWISYVKTTTSKLPLRPGQPRKVNRLYAQEHAVALSIL